MEPTAGLAQTSLVQRYFTTPGVDPLDEVEWVRRDAWPRTGDEKMDKATEGYFNTGILVPAFWRQNDLDVTSKLYLSKADPVERKSVRRLIERVWSKITLEAQRAGYVGQSTPEFAYDFVSDEFIDAWAGDLPEDAAALYAEGCYLAVHQMAAFNSPVWFNVGRDDRIQQVSACYILRIDDNTASLTDANRRNAYIFKYGSGAGYNLSFIRGDMEPLSTGGVASGPLSFRRMFDATNGTFKSGGMTRRAAELVCMDDDHPNLVQFIEVKPREEERQAILIKNGVNLTMGEEGERNLAECTSYQNANMSVRLTNRFMRKFTGEDDDPMWRFVARVTGEPIGEPQDVRALFRSVAEAAWKCADPGVQYHDHFNDWHTTPMIDGEPSPIRSTNPCFPGNTLVDTSEGRIRIDELAGMYAQGVPLPYAFGWDRNEELPAMKRIRQASMTKMITELVEVTTDKGVVFQCTPDHKILTRVHGRGPSGEYVEAQHLQPGQRLRKIGHATNENRSGRGTINHRTTESAPNGTIWRSVFMWEQAYGPIPDGMEVHHRNEDPTDDRLSNLELIDEGTHQSFHSAGERNGRYIEVTDEALVEVFEAIEATGQATPSRWNSYIDRNSLGGVIPKAASPSRGGLIRGMSWDDFVLWVEDHKALINDSVQSVKRFRLDRAIPVYDISVDDVHNFGVATPDVEHTIVVANCGEYASNDDTSCNLASINLVPFVDDGPDEEAIEEKSALPTIEDYRRFKVEDFRHTVDTMIVAMDVLVELSDFPDDPERGGQGKFRHYTKRLRQLGLGYCNLGGALMTQCIPYDSEEGRDWGASVAALMTGRAYRKSAELAQRMGAFHYFGENRESMHGVINKHIGHLRDVSTFEDGHSIWFAAEQDWMDARDRGLVHGYRNAQASVLAPTGSISYLMGCDSTGVEPVFDKVTLKILAGGGEQIMVADCVQHAAQLLGGYSDENLKQMSEGDFSCISEEDRTIFHGANEISVEGHILMLGRIQPFISGGISKTVNLPERATVQDIVDAYLLAWRQGVKNVAIYRNNSKVRQVLHSYKPPEEEPFRELDQRAEQLDDFVDNHPEALDDRIAAEVDPRRRMPRTRKSITHKISIRAAAGREHEGYVHVGFYPDGGIGEFFIEGFGKSGSFTLNALGQWATDFSIAIQYGVPFDVLIRKAAYTSDETGGVVVPDPHGEPLVIRTCESVIDYIARYLASVSGDEDLCEELGVMTPEVKERKEIGARLSSPATIIEITPTGIVATPNGHARETVIGPECSQCGQRMFRSGACWACHCGSTTGCG